MKSVARSNAGTCVLTTREWTERDYKDAHPNGIFEGVLIQKISNKYHYAEKMFTVASDAPLTIQDIPYANIYKVKWKLI